MRRSHASDRGMPLGSFQLLCSDVYISYLLTYIIALYAILVSKYVSELRVEQGLTSHSTQIRSFRRRCFTGLMTQPTVSKHWRRVV